jgi:hypothetical protein
MLSDVFFIVILIFDMLNIVILSVDTKEIVLRVTRLNAVMLSGRGATFIRSH